MSNSMGNVASNQSISHAFYTYAHINPSTNKIFYIGKGKSYRLNNTSKRNQHWKNIVKKYGFKSQILAYWDTEQEALNHEELLISCFKDMGYKLANKADGGKVNSGWKHSEEFKEKLKIRFKGKFVSQETKEKLRIAALNRPKRVISEAHKEKNRIALKGRQYSAETLKKMSDAAKNRALKKAKKEEL